MHVLVTRPEAEAAAFGAQLEALGHTVTVEPLLRVEFVPIARAALDGATGLVVTSRNAVRALHASPAIDKARKLPLFAVGPGTAQLARDLGFEQVLAGSGSAAGLVPVLLEAARAHPGPLVHVRGEEVAFDLKGALDAHGVELRETIGYRTVAVETLSPRTRSLLASGEIDAVILMSPLTGLIFSRLIAAEGLGEAARKLVLLCLSPAVAAAVEPLGAARIEIADSPDASSILEVVSRVATLWSGV